MGLFYSNARLLLQAIDNGFSFERVITLGRQQISIDAREYKALADEFDSMSPDLHPHDLATETYADRFLKDYLGCRELQSIDFSDYQEATIRHDLNLPIVDSLHRKFDAVIDCGTLEHIFNFPIALKNCMEMVRIGGCIMLATTSNNHCGHGFHQFSPELFFRVFQPNHGFEIQKVILIEHPFPGVELSRRQRCYEVIDPDVLRTRVGLVSRSPVLIQVLAKRVNPTQAFETFPQQSDYENLWNANAAENAHKSGKAEVAPTFEQLTATGKVRRIAGTVVRALENGAPKSLQRWIQGKRQLQQYSLRNRFYYRPWK